MRLLVLLPCVPWPIDRGVYQRAYHLLRGLAAEHQVDLFCLDDEGRATSHGEFASFCSRVLIHRLHHPAWPGLLGGRLFEPLPTTVTHWRDSGARAAFEAFADAGGPYDLIFVTDLVLFPYVRSRASRTPVVLDRTRVDLLFQQEELNRLRLNLRQRLLRKENMLKLRRLERAAAAELAATVVCGPDDETFLRAEVSTTARIEVLANGVDATYFDAETHPPTPDAEPTLLFCGAMDYSPNVDGIRWYFDTCDAAVLESVPNRRILIVGRNPAPAVQELASIPGVTVTGGVPDVRPYYQRAWGQIVPLRIGGGTRLKIVESLALGTPVLSTTLGAQGLDLVDQEHILLADAPASFAAAAVELLTRPTLRDGLSRAGRTRVLDLYPWPRLAARLSLLLNDIASNSRTHARHAA